MYVINRYERTKVKLGMGNLQFLKLGVNSHFSVDRDTYGREFTVASFEFLYCTYWTPFY